MQTKIKIIKRGELASTIGSSSDKVERTALQSERETAKTVKSWIAEWEARNRVVQAAAFLLLRSLDGASNLHTIS